MSEYRWLTDLSKQFLEKDYLLPGESVDERIDVICNAAEKRLNMPGFAKAFKENIKKGWYSLSTPVWTNFGNDRGLPISCFGSMIEDSMDSILETHAEVSMMTKYGGGTSAYFGKVRPRGADIKNNGKSSGSVHFMQLFNTAINVTSQGNCYKEGTEVLTNNGFKDFRNVLPTDKLAQIDVKNNLTFTSDYELVQSDFDGYLKVYQGLKNKSSVSLSVTPNHRMVVQRVKTLNKQRYWSDSFEEIIAENLNLHRDNRFVLASRCKDGNGISFEDRLRIAFQADGIKDGENRKIRFHFSKQRKIKRLEWILKSLNKEYVVSPQIDGTIDIAIDYDKNIKHNTFKDWINLEDVNYQWGTEFLEELSHWDGTVCKKHMTYSSVIKENVNLVQAIASMCLKQTRCRTRKAYDNRQELHSITVQNVYWKGGDSVSVVNEPYKGKVYCAIVPEGRLLVRHNNRVAVCGNTRRGSCAAYLPVDHPDIEEFLAIKSEGNPIQDLHFGVCVPDYWMNEMIEGDKQKRKVWAKVLAARANVGYPYIFFSGNAQKGAADVYQDKNMEILHSNLCTEIFLPNKDDESFVCDLSSMNILYFDEWKDTNAVELMIYFLDAVMSEFIEKAKPIKFMHRAVKFAERHRALGLGWLGWHSYLQSKMIPFESMEAKLLNVKVAKTLKEQAYAASAKLAEKFGECDLTKGYGRRNTTLLAIAPTKSSAFILGQVSEGIEPHRANYYIKDLAKGKFSIKNVHLQKLLKEKGFDNQETWTSILRNDGSVQHLSCLSQEEKEVFKTFSEISQKEIIIQASQRQKYIDQGQSLNLMIHPSTPTKEVNSLLIEAWSLGVKSLYYQISINAAQDLAKNILNCSSCES